MLYLDDSVAPLLSRVRRTFMPLMQQGLDARRRHRDAGETLFHEPAFDRSRALFDGTLWHQPFRGDGNQSEAGGG